MDAVFIGVVSRIPFYPSRALAPDTAARGECFFTFMPNRIKRDEQDHDLPACFMLHDNRNRCDPLPRGYNRTYPVEPEAQIKAKRGQLLAQKPAGVRNGEVIA
jgi:hypothetical protein